VGPQASRHDNIDADLTLPSVVSSLPDKHRDQELTLTIIFHPDTSRIGQTAVVPRQTGSAPWILGRRSPAFSGGTVQVAEPLEDPHISRQALEFLPRGKQLVVRRFAASSRCRIAGSGLDDSVELEPEELRRGVPLMLGHTVVLLLRLARRGDPGAGESEFGGLLRGGSAYMAGLRKQIIQTGGSDLDVLIRGETGTGKELVAVAIHGASRRAGTPLVSVNMAAIPSELAAAALFGSAKGAFTGADRAGVGYFQQAQGGILFLDEIGDTSADVQPQLLRALQQREIQSVGGAIRQVDVRVISATDAALEDEACDFKAALRHRLGACEIQILPLREHPEDIGELLLYFLTLGATESQRSGILPQAHSSAPDIAAWAGLFYRFLCYSWPGNVRELANFAQQVVLASERQLTLVDSVETALERGAAAPQAVPDTAVRRRMQAVDEEEFERALQDNHFEAARAAKQLGVSRTAVYRRIEESPRHRLAKEVPRDELQRALAENKGDSTAAAMQLRVSVTSLRARLRRRDRE
jgi:two-component system nitrogen regulation response regulator GlnG